MRELIVFFLMMASVTPVFAEGWASHLTSHDYGPRKIVAVSKKQQTLVVLERQSPLHEVMRFPCTTGQSKGDKAVEGDMRTPEGVYFVGRKINRQLDWELFGNLAYSLNYPNPVDRIKGKTGSGIWLHGRGKTFVPRDTRGCIALKISDMVNVEQGLAKGMPVVVAKDVHWSSKAGENAETAQALAHKIQSWAEEWGQRSDAFFDFYNAKSMTISEGQDFNRFILHKKKIFADNPWIHVYVDNIHVLRGPDYWVTWFDQYYRTSGLISNTGKRFYWMQDTESQWRIVGREYIPASEDLEKKYLSLKLEEANNLVGLWKKSWLAMDAESYGRLYTSRAVQGRRQGASSIIDYKKSLWAKAAPAKVRIDDLSVSVHPRGLKVAFLQTFEDQSGYSDVGRKTMVLVPDGSTWKIDNEQWRRVR